MEQVILIHFIISSHIGNFVFLSSFFCFLLLFVAKLYGNMDTPLKDYSVGKPAHTSISPEFHAQGNLIEMNRSLCSILGKATYVGFFFFSYYGFKCTYETIFTVFVYMHSGKWEKIKTTK